MDTPVKKLHFYFHSCPIILSFSMLSCKVFLSEGMYFSSYFFLNIPKYSCCFCRFYGMIEESNLQ